MFNLRYIARLLVLSLTFIMFSYTCAMAFDHAIGSRALNNGAMPPATNQKLMYVNYNSLYDSTLTDADGNDTPVDITVAAQTHRFIYFTGAKIFGADYILNLALPVANVSFDVSGNKSASSGLIDPFFEPLNLHWSMSNLEVIFGLGFTLPMGSDELSGNHWTITPSSAITYYPTEERLWNFTIIPALEFHSSDLEENDYREGCDFHFEWAIGRQFGSIQVGIVGYDQWQITEDDGSLESGAPITTDSELHAIGLAAQFPAKLFDGAFEVSYNHDYKAENETKGDRFFITFIKPL